MVIEQQIIDNVAPVERQELNGQRPHNLQLLLANLQSATNRFREGAAIAFTSATTGDGASHVTQLFAAEMARHTGRRTLVINAERLQQLGVEDYLQMPWNCNPTNIENLWMLPAKKSRRSNGHHAKQEEVLQLPKKSFLMRMSKEQEEIDTGLNCVDALRVSFDNILIDCRPIMTSGDAAMLAAQVDGIVVVAEAGRARRDEILNAQRTVKLAGGNFLGFVLNKRKYPVPEWLYRRL